MLPNIVGFIVPNGMHRKCSKHHLHFKLNERRTKITLRDRAPRKASLQAPVVPALAQNARAGHPLLLLIQLDQKAGPRNIKGRPFRSRLQLL